MKINFAVKTAKIVGTPDNFFWSQTHSFCPEDGLKKVKRGDLLAVLVIEGLAEGVEAISAGREILGRLHEEYYGNLEGSAFERLGLAVRKVCLEREGVSIVTATLLGEVIYLAIFGEGKILLKRQGKLGVVLSGEGDLVTASGFIKDNDLIVLGSEKFFEAAGSEVLKTTLESNELEQAVELIAPSILGQAEMADAVAIMGLFKKSQEEFKVEEISAPSLESPKENVKPAEKKILNRVYVHKVDFASKKRFYFVLSLLLLVILGFGFVFGIKKSHETKKIAEAKILFSQAEEKFNQAKVVFTDDPGRGRSLAQEAKEAAGKALLVKSDFGEAQLISEQIETFLSSSQQEIVLSGTKTLMDLNLILDGAQGVSLAVMDKNLVILDSAKKKVYLLDYEKKSHTVFEISAEKGTLLTSYEDRIMVFSDKGVEEIYPENKSVLLRIGKDEEWGEITGISSFGRNLYLLDSKGSNLWRYSASGDGFGSKKSWFAENPPDLSGAVSLAIDGSVWVLEKEKILKFNLGKPENFVLSKMQESFDDPTRIYTSTESQNLYVLDKDKGKIFVIGKNGEFKIAYSGEEIKQADDLAAVESINKIFLLSGSKVYEIELR